MTTVRLGVGLFRLPPRGIFFKTRHSPVIQNLAIIYKNLAIIYQKTSY